ncbi:MAG: ACT domain-containing protein [Betaproteobacteria bacterium]|nr:ACT domain-containing protein [Betaproteobacteria bacterium]MDE2056853.1 ACT domain-containing protein [Betaproteobacteria bacterium]
MKIVLTIIGEDRVGIVSRVSTKLADFKVNILDINQNILKGFFNMVMIAEMTDQTLTLKELQNEFNQLGDEIGVTVKIQHADIFTAMHRI